MNNPKCKCCGTEMEVAIREIMIPCYDDGGSLDSFDVEIERIKVCTNPMCDREEYDLSHRAVHPQEDDDLPF